MKEQTFILKMKDDNGITKDFYRFSCKRSETVLKELKKTVKGNNRNFWFSYWEGENIKQIICYNTQNAKEEKTWKYTIEELKAM